MPFDADPMIAQYAHKVSRQLASSHAYKFASVAVKAVIDVMVAMSGSAVDVRWK